MPLASRARALALTLLGLVLILGGVLLSLVSGFALLSILAGGYGSGATTLSGFLTVVVAPPLAAVAGVGLLLRRRWALATVVAGLTVFLGWSVVEAVRPPAPTVIGRLTDAGWTETLVPGTPQHALPGMAPVIAGAALVLGFLLLPAVRRDFARTRGETGTRSSPAGPAIPAPAPDAAPPPRPLRPRAVPPGDGATAGQRRALPGVVALLLGAAAVAGWQIRDALVHGAVALPAKGAARPEVLRAEDPALFWASVGVLSAGALLCLGLAVWLAAAGRGRRR